MLFGRSLNIGFLLLSIYLILVGLTSLVATITISTSILALLALGAGIFILIGR